MKTKRIISLLFALIITVSLPFSALAGDEIKKEESMFFSNYGEEYATENNGIILMPRVEDMTSQEMNQFGQIKISELASLTRSTGINKYCYVIGYADVYSTATGNTTIGFVDERERVYAYEIPTGSNRCRIEFLNYGELDYGYVSSSVLGVPETYWSRPILTGSISQDYGENGHTGIDVAAATGTSIITVDSGYYTSYYTTYTQNGTTYLANFGNHIKTVQTVNGVQYEVVYAHLSSFKNGGAITTLPSYRQYVSPSNTTTVQVNSNYELMGDYLGEVGNTGYSSGSHLHFEVRSASNTSIKYDPYQFVVFPRTGY